MITSSKQEGVHVGWRKVSLLMFLHFLTPRELRSLKKNPHFCFLCVKILLEVCRTSTCFDQMQTHMPALNQQSVSLIISYSPPVHSACSSAICTLDVTEGKPQAQQIIIRMLMESGGPAALESTAVVHRSFPLSEHSCESGRVISSGRCGFNVAMNG